MMVSDVRWVEFSDDNATRIVVVDNPGEKIPAEHRRDWLAAVHPDANLRVIPDIGKDDDSIAWAAHTTKFLHYVPDAVFTSETTKRSARIVVPDIG